MKLGVTMFATDYAMRPDDLTADSEIGHRLLIPLPQGG